MSVKEEIQAMTPLEKIHLIDELLLSLDMPNKEIDKIWAEEAEKRIKAYDEGKIKAIPVEEVFAKYKKI